MAGVGGQIKQKPLLDGGKSPMGNGDDVVITGGCEHLRWDERTAEPAGSGSSL